MFEELKPHLAELRKRLVICVLSVIVLFIACFGFWEDILGFMTRPLVRVLPKGSEIIFTQLG
ncbi:MAG: twin-arginine translocase subunit TatC, partial [Campylobacter sp.]